MSKIAGFIGQINVWNNNIPEFNQLQKLTSSNMSERADKIASWTEAQTPQQWADQYWQNLDQKLSVNSVLYKLLNIDHRYLSIRRQIRLDFSVEKLQQELRQITDQVDYQNINTAKDAELLLDQLYIQNLISLYHESTGQLQAYIKNKIQNTMSNLVSRGTNISQWNINEQQNWQIDSQVKDIRQIYQQEHDFIRDQQYSGDQNLTVIAFYTKLKLYLYDLGVLTEISNEQQAKENLVNYEYHYKNSHSME